MATPRKKATTGPARKAKKKPAAGKKKTSAKTRPKAKAKAKPKVTTKKATAKKAVAKKAVAKKAVAKKAAAKKPSVKKTAVKLAATKKKPAPVRSAKKKKPAPAVKLTARERRHYTGLLEKKKQALTAAYLLAKGDSVSDLDDGTEDYIDYAVHSYAREFLLSLTELERRQLFLVEEALERAKRPEFGSCANCGKAQPAKRLEVAPWARYCVPCQELEEQGLLPVAGESDEESVDEESEASADDSEDAEETA